VLVSPPESVSPSPIWQAKRALLRSNVRGLYDLQKLRIQTGNRITAQFKLILGQMPSEAEEGLPPAAKALLVQLRSDFARITDAVVAQGGDPGNWDQLLEAQKWLEKDTKKAKSESGEVEDSDEETTEDAEEKTKACTVLDLLLGIRTAVEAAKLEANGGKPPKGKKKNAIPASFVGNRLISEQSELALIDGYAALLSQEKAQAKALEPLVESWPIWTEYLSKVRGIAHQSAAVIIAELNPYKAKYPSSFWKFAGLDVAADQRARSKRSEHMVDKTYTDADGKEAVRKSITFSPFIHDKLLGVVASSIVKAKKENPKKPISYRELYYDFKNRQVNHVKYGEHNDGKKDENDVIITSKGRRHRQALRRMIKLMLIDLYKNWRAIEGLTVHPPYHEAKLGYAHGRDV
jgi:hypothetical protein